MRKNATDWTGHRFGTQTILGVTERQDAHGRHYWTARCDCGRVHEVLIRDVKRNTSCGCRKNATIAAKRRAHGMSKHPAWAVWQGMKQRCTDPNHKAWKNYGGRGITVCDRWLHSFEAFWADMGLTYQPGLDIDRRDNDAGYTPENCRWVTRKVQNNNRRTNIKINTPRGRMTVAELADQTGINRTTLYYRVAHGVAADCLCTPADVRNRFTTSKTAGRGIGTRS